MCLSLCNSVEPKDSEAKSTSERSELAFSTRLDKVLNILQWSDFIKLDEKQKELFCPLEQHAAVTTQAGTSTAQCDKVTRPQMFVSLLHLITFVIGKRDIILFFFKARSGYVTIKNVMTVTGSADRWSHTYTPSKWGLLRPYVTRKRL